MPTVITARDLKAVLKLPFCYICGKPLTWPNISRDHVPPKGCFSQLDRTQNPLELPTHPECNNSFHISDESVGQFLSMLHGKKPKEGAPGLRHTTVGGDPRFQAATNVNLYGSVERWVRAFHSALYQHSVPPNVKFATELPMDVLSANETNGPAFLDVGRPQQRELCEKTILDNRATKTIDRLVAWNGKLQYECVWVLTPQHSYCVFWIDLYGWRRLARINMKPPRECVGFYSLFPAERPPGTTIQSQIVTDENPTRFLF
jgi:hypothetical protein